jgi:phospho-N-acetylmuramoyl-pentapeptide-transferase
VISTVAQPMLFAGAAGLVLGWVILPLLRTMNAGQQVREDGPPTHLRKAGTPTFGGLVIILAVLVGVLGARTLSGRGLVALLAMVVFGVIGFADDYLKSVLRRPSGWRARYRFGVELLVGLAFSLVALKMGRAADGLWASYIIVPWSVAQWDLGWLFVPLSTLLVVGMANAVNLTDGLDGLAAGITAIVVMALAAVCFLAGDFPLVPVAAAIAGACLAFLWFNGHPAEVFMGDTGSLALGGALGVMAVLSGLHLVLMLAGAVFCWEALSVMLQVASFKTTGKRVFRMAPFHHHLELLNWPETRVVSRLWVMSVLCAALAVTSLRIAP